MITTGLLAQRETGQIETPPFYSRNQSGLRPGNQSLVLRRLFHRTNGREYPTAPPGLKCKSPSVSF